MVWQIIYDGSNFYSCNSIYVNSNILKQQMCDLTRIYRLIAPGDVDVSMAMWTGN